MSTLPAAAVASLFIVATAACDHTVDGAERDAEELKADAVEQADRAGRAIDVEMVKFQRGAGDALADVDAKLERIRQRTASAGAAVKEDTARQIEALEKERAELARKVDQATINADVEWEATKRSLDESIAKLGRDADGVLDDLGDEIRESTD
jgi:hypothetical protein